MLSTVDSINRSLPLIPILLDEVTCTGEEKMLTQCAHDGFDVHDCSHMEDLVVACLRKLILKYYKALPVCVCVQLESVLKGKCAWLKATVLSMMEMWSYVWMECGLQCVILPGM